MLTATDASLASGYCGLGMLDHHGTVVSYKSSVATSFPALSSAFSPGTPGEASWIVYLGLLIAVAFVVSTAVRRMRMGRLTR
jgi:hypothetical protein